MAGRNETGRNRTLTAKQERAATLLAEGLRPTRVAREIGISRTTLLGWRRQPVFVARFNEARRDAQDALVVRVRALQLKALDVVSEVLDDGEADLRHRLAACRVVAKLCPMPAQREPGPTDPAVIAARQEVEQAKERERQRVASLTREERLAETIQEERRQTAEFHALLAAGSGIP